MRLLTVSEHPLHQWIRLRQSGLGDGTLEVPSLPTDVETGFGLVRFALGEQNEPRLLVPFGSLEHVHRSNMSPKLAVGVSRFRLDTKPMSFIDVRCLDRALDGVFAELADEIIHRVKQGNSPWKAVDGAIADFRELLRDSEPSDVEDRKIIGLFGELLVLRDLARHAPTAVGAWVGPYEQRHDFRRGQHAIEVKTSARNDATVVSINGSEQLAEPEGGTLTLIHVRVERAHAGLSIESLFGDLCELGVEEKALREGLAACTCRDPKSIEWNRVRFGLEGVTAYRVVDPFPRIVSAEFRNGQFPAGVSSLRYEIDLDAAAEHVIPDADRADVLKRIAE